MIKKQIKIILAASLCAFLNQGHAEVAMQRADSGVVVGTEQAKVAGNRLTVDFELSQPGDYVIQLVHQPAAVGQELAASVQVNGAFHCEQLERSYK